MINFVRPIQIILLKFNVILWLNPGKGVCELIFETEVVMSSVEVVREERVSEVELVENVIIYILCFKTNNIFPKFTWYQTPKILLFSQL